MNSCKALIIDGSKSAQIGLRKKLQSFDFEVDLATSGPEAINRLTESSQQLPNVIFLNRHQPEMEWLEITKTIKSNPIWQNITIVMCSFESSQDIKQKAIESGIDAVIPKPATRQQIQEIILNLGIEEINTSKVSNPRAHKHNHVSYKNRSSSREKISKHTVDNQNPHEGNSNSQSHTTITKGKKNRSTLLNIEKYLITSLDARTKRVTEEINQSLEMRTRQIVSPVLVPLIDATIKEQLRKKVDESTVLVEQNLLNRFQLEFSALSKGFWEKTNYILANKDKIHLSKTGELIKKAKKEIQDSINIEINTIRNEISNDNEKLQLRQEISQIKNGQSNTTGKITSIVSETKRLGQFSNDLKEKCDKHSKTISSLVAHSTDIHNHLKQLDSRIDATKSDILGLKVFLEKNSLDHRNLLGESEKLTLNQKSLQETVDDLKQKVFSEDSKNNDPFNTIDSAKDLLNEKHYHELNNKIFSIDNRLLEYEEQLSLMNEAAAKVINFESINQDKKGTNSEPEILEAPKNILDNQSDSSLDNGVKELYSTVIELESKISTLSDALRESQSMYMLLASDTGNLDIYKLNQQIKESAEENQKKMTLVFTDQISSELEKSIFDLKQDVEIKLDYQESRLKNIMRTIYVTLGLSTICALALFVLKMSH